MENHVNFLKPLIENAKVYEKTSIELYKLKAIEKISETSSTLVSRVMAFSLLVLFILMVSVGVAFWLGNFMNKTSLLFKLGLVRKLTNLIQSGVLNSEISQKFSLDEVRQAVISAEDSSKLGKTLLKIGE